MSNPKIFCTFVCCYPIIGPHRRRAELAQQQTRFVAQRLSCARAGLEQLVAALAADRGGGACNDRVIGVTYLPGLGDEAAAAAPVLLRTPQLENRG